MNDLGMPGIRELKMALARLGSLFEFHPDGVFTLDLDGRFTSLNARALELSGGHSVPALIGRSFSDLLPEQDVAGVSEHFATLVAGTPDTFEVRLVRSDGSFGELEIIGLPIIVDGEVVEICGIAEDITARKELQQTLELARHAAESATDSKSAFMATMSHEIRTPLTSVLASAELLAETQLSDDQQLLVTVMDRSGERLLSLVNDILDFSTIEAGKAEIVELPFILSELVERTLLIMQRTIEDKGLDLECYISADLPYRLIGDPERIAQVLTNLVDNAAKFTHEGRVVLDISMAGATADGAQVRFAVSDTGIGLSEEEQVQVFDLFRQGDDSITRAYGGTGLGLAICRELVALMGGKLDVDSELGKGSTFAFVLPLVRSS